MIDVHFVCNICKLKKYFVVRKGIMRTPIIPFPRGRKDKQIKKRWRNKLERI